MSDFYDKPDGQAGDWQDPLDDYQSRQKYLKDAVAEIRSSRMALMDEAYARHVRGGMGAGRFQRQVAKRMSVSEHLTVILTLQEGGYDEGGLTVKEHLETIIELQEAKV